MKVAVFGSSEPKEGDKIYSTGKLLGKSLAEEGHSIVTGGYSGLMEAPIKGANKYNVNRIGIITEHYSKQPNKYLTDIIKAGSYGERMQSLIEYADAYIIMPGGTGTLLEFSAVWAYRQRGIHDKPVILFGSTWRKIIDILSKDDYFIKSIDNLIIADNIDEIIELLEMKNKSGI